MQIPHNSYPPHPFHPTLSSQQGSHSSSRNQTDWTLSPLVPAAGFFGMTSSSWCLLVSLSLFLVAYLFVQKQYVISFHVLSCSFFVWGLSPFPRVHLEFFLWSFFFLLALRGLSLYFFPATRNQVSCYVDLDFVLAPFRALFRRFFTCSQSTWNSMTPVWSFQPLPLVRCSPRLWFLVGLALHQGVLVLGRISSPSRDLGFSFTATRCRLAFSLTSHLAPCPCHASHVVRLLELCFHFSQHCPTWSFSHSSPTSM